MSEQHGSAPRATLTCPVAGCSEPLAWEATRVLCARGHLVDRARSGYCNLLQVQERRSRLPGDGKAAVQARRRCLQRGLGAVLLEAIGEQISAWGLGPEAAVLDAGCGEGYHLQGLCARFGFEGWGVDISRAAIEAAAKAHPLPRWVISNADRTLPFADGSFDLVTSITARKNPGEFHRLLAPGGHLLVVVAHEDDQRELRGLLFGEVPEPERSGATEAAFAGRFELEGERVIRSRALLDPDGLRDLLIGSYRGGRLSAREGLAALGALEVTLAYRILAFRPR